MACPLLDMPGDQIPSAIRAAPKARPAPMIASIVVSHRRPAPFWICRRVRLSFAGRGIRPRRTIETGAGRPVKNDGPGGLGFVPATFPPMPTRSRRHLSELDARAFLKVLGEARRACISAMSIAPIGSEAYKAGRSGRGAGRGSACVPAASPWRAL